MRQHSTCTYCVNNFKEEQTKSFAINTANLLTNMSNARKLNHYFYKLTDS